MTDAPTPQDRRAKRGLFLAIVAGLVIGLVLGVPRYGLMDPSTWNLMGLIVIGTVGLYAVFLLARALRARRGEPTQASTN